MDDDKTNRITSMMTPAPLETANRSDNIDTIIRTITVKNKGSVVILNELKHPEGIITERDIVEGYFLSLRMRNLLLRQK